MLCKNRITVVKTQRHRETEKQIDRDRETYWMTVRYVTWISARGLVELCSCYAKVNTCQTDSADLVEVPFG